MTFILIILSNVIYFKILDYFNLELAAMNLFLGAVVFIFVPLIIIPFTVFGIFSSLNDAKRIKQVAQIIQQKGFQVSFHGKFANTIIFVDGENSKICIAELPLDEKLPVPYAMYDSHSLLSSRIIQKQGSEVATKSSGVRYIRRRIYALHLRLIVDDADKKSYRIPFNSSLTGTPGPVLRKIQKWQLIMELIMMGEKIPQLKSLEQIQDHIDYIRLKKLKVVR